MSAPTRPPLYPLRFKEILRDYTFGGRWIVREFRKSGLPDDHRISETWEVCDRPGESSEITRGPLAGRTLREAIDAYGADLLGEAIVDRFGSVFPLLIKLLDATHPLGEQVHPDDDLAGQIEPKELFGKTEAWYMLRARRGAKIFCGNRPGVTVETLRAALRADKARGCMSEYAAAPGDAFLLYAGTMHYAPGGVLFYEIMQNSDITLGLRPRPGLAGDALDAWADGNVRAVRLEEGFDCRTRPATLSAGANRRAFVLACEHFAVERLDLREPFEATPDGSRFHVLTVIEGEAAVVAGGRTERLAAGQTCLLPARLASVTVEPTPVAALLRATVPDLAADVIAPLRAAGVADDAIAALGGRTVVNPLAALL